MSELTCRDVVEFLMDYIEGGLDARQRAEFETHLTLCDDCVAYLRQYEDAVRLGKVAFERPEASADGQLAKRLVQAILAARKKER
jgi:anti-sigma factor RsiW